jgi:membrane fusion protein (multidrug efflux system)
MPEKSSPFLRLRAVPLSLRGKLARAIGAIIGVVLLALVATAVWWRFAGPDLVFDAVVDGERGLVTVRSTGRVMSVRAEVGQVISAGQPLIFLAPLSETDLSADTRERLENLRERITAEERTEKDAQEAVSQAALAHARKQLALRKQPAAGSGNDAARKDMERLRAEESAARAGLEAAKNRAEAASLARLNVENAYRQTREALLHQTGTRGKPAQTAMTAPMAGRLSSLDARPGMTVQPGQTLAEIDPILPDQLWIVGFVKPANVTKLRPETVFALRFPDHPDLRLSGQIDAIQDDPPQKNLPGLPVRIRLNDYDPLTMPPLSVGEKAEAREKR